MSSKVFLLKNICIFMQYYILHSIVCAIECFFIFNNQKEFFMSSLNCVMLIGRLGHEPEIKYGQSGNAVLSMNIATDESYTDSQGEYQERTEWHTIVCYKRLAENCAAYLTKGSLVFVQGSLNTRKWQDKEANERISTEIRASAIRFLDKKSNTTSEQKPNHQNRQNKNRGQNNYKSASVPF